MKLKLMGLVTAAAFLGSSVAWAGAPAAQGAASEGAKLPAKVVAAGQMSGASAGFIVLAAGTVILVASGTASTTQH